MNLPQQNARELLLLRHAKSSGKNKAGDLERSLTDKGKSHAEQIGLWLKKYQIPDFIICSPARRARKTAEIVCQQLNISEDKIQIEPQLYNADLSDILSVLASCPPHRRKILLVGHNPSIETLIHYLASTPVVSNLSSGKLVLPATLVRFSFDKNWHQLIPHDAELMSITHGKLLPEDDASWI